MKAIDFVMPGTSIAKIECTILSNFYTELLQKFAGLQDPRSEALNSAGHLLKVMEYNIGKVEEFEMPSEPPIKMTDSILNNLATAERQYSYYKKGTYPLVS